MATIKVKNSVTSGSNPSGLTFGELAVNIADRKIYIGNAVGSTITIHDQNNIVTSVNGATGAITNVAKTNEGNTFSVQQVFNAGITASSTSNVLEIVATTDGCGLRIAQEASGSNARVGGIRLGRSSTSTANSYIENYIGQLKFFNGISGTNGTPGLNMFQLSTTNAQFGVPIDGATFSSTTGEVKIRRTSYLGGDSAYLRIVGTDGLGTEYNSDIRANADAVTNTIHTLPATTGTLLNSNFNSYVSSYNGRTGAIQGVSAASAGSGISVSGATGEVTITNTGVLSFNGSTGAVQGVASVNGQTGAVAITYAAASTITSSNVNGTRYITFVGGTGNTGIFIDDVTTPLSYNPQQGNIGAKKVTLTTGSSVITIDSITPVVTLTDGANVSTFGLDSFASSNGIPFELSAAVGLTLTSSSGGIAMSGSGYYYKFPESNGTNGHILTTNGSGSLSWGTTVAGISASAGICGGAHVRAESGYRLGTSSLNARTGTTYTLLSTDDGKIITSANAATQTITIPAGLPVGFNCTIIQLGTGGVGITSGVSATLASYQNKFNIVGQYAAATVVSYSSDIFVLVGGLTG